MKKLIFIFVLMLALGNILSVKAGNITVTAPNGGEVWAGCTSQKITWIAEGTQNNYTIDYSTDGGKTWVSVTSSLYVTNGTYNWLIPNINSTNCLVRVIDSNNPSTLDISDKTFSITAPLLITYPDGGETLQAGSVKPITWVANGTSNIYNLYYSTDAGSNWKTITTKLSTTNKYYDWTVPNDPSNQCLIRIQDDNNKACMVDESNYLFTIIPPQPFITVTNPNSATTFFIGKAYSITWSSGYLASSLVKIDYSIDNGSKWIPITTSTQNTGTYSWTTPNTPSDYCLIKITDLGNPLTKDSSNVNFKISNPYIVLNSPNGGETLSGCNTFNITWTGFGASGYYNIYYSIDYGKTWTSIASNLNSTIRNWSPVPNINTNNCLIKVSDYNNPTIKDSSDAVFNIIPNNEIILTNPNGGELLEPGTNYIIKWASSAANINFKLYYSTDNGVSWTIINSSSTSAKTYTWQVPNKPSDKALIKVIDSDNTCKMDVSDAAFTIIQPTHSIKVTAPNTAVTLYSGNNTYITWTSAYLSSDFVKIDYSIDSGNNWINITNTVENSGSYSWAIPPNYSENCRVKVSEYNNSEVFDISDVDFIIAKPYIKLNSPAGAEIWKSCNAQNISWTKYGFSDYVKILLSIDNGKQWETLNSSASGNAFSWTPNKKIQYNNCYIKVVSTANQTIADSNKIPLSLLPNDDIIITYPNGGEDLVPEETAIIKWVSATTSNTFDVYYSTNGTNYTKINTSNIYSKSYSWTVPNSPGSNYFIKVRDYNNQCIEDVSDAAFNIIKGTATVKYPNGGESIYYGSSYNISWKNNFFYTNYVSIYYSVDNGQSWNAIAYVADNTGSYQWSVPNTYSENCLVKIADYTNPSVFDISDKVFNILPGLTILTPNGDNGTEEWRVCTKTTIKWTSGGSSAKFKIDYSYDNGKNWTLISSNYSSSGSNNTFDWDIPNTPSTKCLVRISDVNYPLKTDISKTTFTIKPSIIVNSPNGTESLTPGSEFDIKWSALGASNYYDINYSINGGSTWTNIAFKQYIDNNLFKWTVPANSSTNCLLKVTDNNNTCKTDLSDNTFAIGLPYPTITLNSFNTGETVTGCSTQNIVWSSTNTSQNYIIEYSKDKGQNWITIVSNYNAPNNTYLWTVPNITVSDALIRVKDFSNQSVKSTSAKAFSITQSFSATINTNISTNICSGSSIILTSGNPSGNVWSPGGQTSQSITVSSAGTYTVAVTSNGCTATSDPVTITVSTLPATPVITSNSPVPLYGTIKLNAGTIAGATYLWSGPNNFNSNIINPEIAEATAINSGVYTVKAIVNGCESKAANASVTVSATPGNVSLTGYLMTETGSKIKGVKLIAQGTSSKDSTTTNNSGAYLFSLKQGNTYILTPSKKDEINICEGITTLDLLLIQKHILNVLQLGSPYRIIAADVNKSATISNLDILNLQSLILGNTKELPIQKQWEFVNSDFTFPNPANPFTYESTRSYSSIKEMQEQNFTGIKIGDVNNSWEKFQTKSAKGSELRLFIDTVTAIKGSFVVITVRANNFKEMLSLQGTLRFDPQLAEFKGITHFGLSGMTLNNFGTTLVREGTISYSWFDSKLKGETIADSTVLFSVMFRVKGDAPAQSIITFDENPTIIELVDKDMNIILPTLSPGSIRISNQQSSGLILQIDSLVSNSVQVLLPVRVRNFKNLMSIQGSLGIDPSKVEITGIEQINLSGMTADNFGFSQSKDGYISFSWFNTSLKGITLEDNTVLFALKLNIKDFSGNKISIDFTDNPAYPEFIDNSYEPISVTLIPGYIRYGTEQKHSIYGILTYDNKAATQMTNTLIYLINSENKTLDSCKTDNTGSYKFNNISKGQYSFIAKSDKKTIKAITPIDALFINRNYLNLYHITSQLRKTAADVTGDSKITPIDALFINRRYLGMIKKFTIADWVFEKVNIIVNGTDVNVNFKALCAGDVDGSFTPDL